MLLNTAKARITATLTARGFDTNLLSRYNVAALIRVALKSKAMTKAEVKASVTY